MKLTMQTALAHTFAVSMAAAVIAFPSPSELLASITSTDTARVIDPVGLPDTLAALAVPAPDQPDRGTVFSTDHTHAALAECAFYLDRAVRPEIEPCRSIIEAAKDTFIEPVGYGPVPQIVAPPSTALTEAMILANAQLCRAEWREAENPASFDLAGCISAPSALVRQID